MSALVSIVMPSYNTGRFIAESIRSVMAQTYTNWELIIVDDCSTDNTMDVLASLCHPERNEVESKDLASRIRVLQNATNNGAAVSRNRAIREARGKYIAFLDSDDLWAPDKLEKQIRFMEENGYDFTYTKYNEIDENGSALGMVVGGPAHIGKTGMFNYCWPGCLTVMYNREVVGDIQIADIKKNNDYAMWLKIIRKAKCHLLPEVLASYRKRTGSISHDCHSERSSAPTCHSERSVAPTCHSERSIAKSINETRNFSSLVELGSKEQNLDRYLSLVKWHYRLYREAEGMNPVSSLWITARNLFFGVMKKFLYVGRG